MSALDDLKNKPYSQRSKIECCIILLWEEPIGYEWLAEQAAEELASMAAAQPLRAVDGGDAGENEGDGE